MKKVFCLCISLILILALCGCGGGKECEHDWQSADCVKPETCSVCGETQGEALGHQFGPWSFGEEDMSHVCTVCSTEEKTAIDRQIQFSELLIGHWDMYSLVFGEDEMSIGELPGSGLDHSLNYEAGGKLIYRPHNPVTGSSTDAMELSFELESYEESSACFYARAQAQDGEEYELELKHNGKEWLLYVKAVEYDGYGLCYGFSRYEDTRPAMIGYWLCSNKSSVYGLELFADGSFQLHGGRELQGNWQMMPDFNGRCRMIYSQNGKNRVGDCHLTSDVGYGSSLVFSTPDGMNLFMDKAEHEDFDVYVKDIEDAEKLPLGLWESTTSYSHITNISRPMPGCQLSVNEDGSFTISGAKSLQGTWKYDSMFTSASGQMYTYELSYSDTGRDGGQMQLDFDGSIAFGLEGEDGKYYFIHFHRFDAEQWEKYEKGPELLPGEYMSSTVVTGDVETVDDSYNLSVHENGTLSGHIIEDISGTWQYYDYSTKFDHLYFVEIDKSLIKGTMSLNEDGVFVLRFRLEGGEDMKIHFVRK